MKPFGHEIKEEFLIEEGYVNVNHSSFGYIPKYIRDIKFELCNKYLENPDKFIRFHFADQYKELRKICAEFLGGNWDQSFITTSSAESFNSIIKNLDLTQEDTILYTNLVYPMVENTIKYMNDRFGIKMEKLEYQIEDLSNEKILQKVEERLKQKQIKVFVFDNITALPSIKMPIYELVKLCQKYDVISIIDAAHGAGIRDINLEILDADFFYTNFNKWAFCPTGVNMLYMKEKYIKQIHHNNISVFYGAGLDKEFEYNGTHDRSNLLVAKEGIQFIKKYGLNNIIQYSEEIAWIGTNMVARIWETQLMVNDRSMHSAMVNVRAPIDDEKILKECQQICCEKYNVLIVFCKFNEKMWARFTGTIYNEISDYEYAAKSVLEVLKEINQ